MKKVVSINELKSGYLIFTRIHMLKGGFRGFLSKLIGGMQVLIGQGSSFKHTYSHVAMVEEEGTDKYILEVTSPKSRRILISEFIKGYRSPYEFEVFRVYRADELMDNGITRKDNAILHFKQHLLGTAYDYLELFAFILPPLKLIEQNHLKVCSSGLAECWYNGANIILSTHGLKDNYVSPDEIAENTVEVEYMGKLDI